MKRLFATIIVLLMGLASADVLAKTLVGGYDIDRIEAATAECLTKVGVVSADDKLDLGSAGESASNDPLVHGSEFVHFYDRLADILVERKAVTTAEIDAARRAAAESGGIKIGGLNPVVLGASFLDLLVRKGVISLQQAQEILDSARQ